MHKRGIVCFEITMKYFYLLNVYDIRHTEAFELKAVCLFAHCHADILVIFALIEMGIAQSNAMYFRPSLHSMTELHKRHKYRIKQP